MLLTGLSEQGFGHEQLTEMQEIIDAQKRELLDVLAYVAFALPAPTREERASRAKVAINTRFNSKQSSSTVMITELCESLSRRRSAGPLELRTRLLNWFRGG
jgi:hypothetical protein